MIRVEKLNKSFGSLHVLKDVDLQVNNGDVVCLIGASGSGKSTLLRCLNFLEIKALRHIYIDRQEIDPEKHDLNKFRQQVGMVFSILTFFHIKMSWKILLKLQSWLKR